jgi:hypothetical protein
MQFDIGKDIGLLISQLSIRQCENGERRNSNQIPRLKPWAMLTKVCSSLTEKAMVESAINQLSIGQCENVRGREFCLSTKTHG